MIENALHERIVTDTGFAAIASSRAYFMIAPQGVVSPYVTFFRVSAGRDRSLGGPSGSAWPRFQIDTWSALSQTQARALFEAIRVRLDGWRGTLDGTSVMACSLQSDGDLIDDEAEPRLFRVRSDWMIHHTE